MKQVRPEPEYFRVGFYGKGFPSSVRVRPLTKIIIWKISNEFVLFHLAWRSFRCLSVLHAARLVHDKCFWHIPDVKCLVQPAKISALKSSGFAWHGNIRLAGNVNFTFTRFWLGSGNGRHQNVCQNVVNEWQFNGGCGNVGLCVTIKSTLLFANTDILT